jgi:hypothetical protein
VGDSELPLCFTQRIDVGNLIQGADGKVREIGVGYSDAYLVCAFSGHRDDDRRDNAREDFYLHRIRLSRMGSCEKFKSPFRPPFFKGGVAEERK